VSTPPNWTLPHRNLMDYDGAQVDRAVLDMLAPGESTRRRLERAGAGGVLMIYRRDGDAAVAHGRGLREQQCWTETAILGVLAARMGPSSAGVDRSTRCGATPRS